MLPIKRRKIVKNETVKVSIFTNEQKKELIRLITWGPPYISFKSIYHFVMPILDNYSLYNGKQERCGTVEIFARFLHDEKLFDILCALLKSSLKPSPLRFLFELLRYSSIHHLEIIEWCLVNISLVSLYKVGKTLWPGVRSSVLTNRVNLMLKLSINPLWFCRTDDNYIQLKVRQKFLQWDGKSYLGELFSQRAITLLLCLSHIPNSPNKNVRNFILRALAVVEFFRMKAESNLKLPRKELCSNLDAVGSTANRPHTIAEFTEIYVDEFSKYALLTYPLLESKDVQLSRWQLICQALRANHFRKLCEIYNVPPLSTREHFWVIIKEDDVKILIQNAYQHFDVVSTISSMLNNRYYRTNVRRIIFMLKCCSEESRRKFCQRNESLVDFTLFHQFAVGQFVSLGIMPLRNRRKFSSISDFKLDYWYSWTPENHKFFTPCFRSSVYGWLLVAKRMELSQKITFLIIKWLGQLCIDGWQWQNHALSNKKWKVKTLRIMLADLNYCGPTPLRKNEIAQCWGDIMAIKFNKF